MKILLVEDEPATCAMLESALINDRYRVEVAVDGRVAVGLAEQFEYDLILLDINIPELDGIGVCKYLRSKGSQIPIMLLTAKDKISDRIIGLDAGADDYIVKPFNLLELLARIRALLRRGRAAVESVISWENLQLDCKLREICYKRQILRLTPKEYGILELLLLNPYRIFSRTVLIDRLWEMEETPTESAISSHIKAIRHKLKAAGANQDLIETVYGFGYRLHPIIQSDNYSQASEPENATNTNADEASILLELWEKFKDSFNEQINSLDLVISALQKNNLTSELRQEAKLTVHKLIGSLGVYGFSQGSILARQIEDLLNPDIYLTKSEILQISQLISDLKQELQREPVFTKTSPSSVISVTVDQFPLVLIVDDDETLTARLEVEAHNQSLRIEVAASLAIAQQVIEQNSLSLILLDLTFADSSKDTLEWLRTLKQKYPQLPVLVFTGSDRLSDRVKAAQLGVQAFLQKPMLSEQIFKAIQSALGQAHIQNFSPQHSIIGKVMIVDDDPAVAHQLVTLLSPWGLDVIPLTDTTNFWQVLTSTVPDLLILDIEMPNFSGIELCQVVRSDPQWGNLPILFITAHHETEIIVRAFAVGGDDYVRKPILEPELIARVLNRLEPLQVRRQQLISTIIS